MPLGFIIFHLQHFGESKDFYPTSTGSYNKKKLFSEQTSCSQCPAGYYCPNQGAAVQCPSGFFSKQGDGACSACAPGSFSSSAGNKLFLKSYLSSFSCVF